MKVIRSSKTTLKFVNKGKIDLLHEVMDEYSRVCNIFIGLVWENEFKVKDLKKEITSIPETWLSARMRQNCAREALSSCDSAIKKAKELKEIPVMPIHYGKRMISAHEVSSDCYGYVYITENLVNGMLYVGQHRSNKDNKYYKGSGVLINRALKKYGQDRFATFVLQECPTIDSLNEVEAGWITQLNCVESDDYYNLEYGGNGYQVTEETKNKISIGVRGKNNYNYGRKGKLNQNYGKVPSEKTRQLWSRIRTGKKQTESTIKKRIKTMNDKFGGSPQRKKVYQLDKSTAEVIDTFESMKKASDYTSTRYTGISLCCSGKQKTANGFKWCYVE